MIRVLFTWSLLLVAVCNMQPCPDVSLYNTALNKTLETTVLLLKDNLPFNFTASIPFRKCERRGSHMFETEYNVTFTNAAIELLGSCKLGYLCKATCPVQVSNLDFTVNQSSPIDLSYKTGGSYYGNQFTQLDTTFDIWEYRDSFYYTGRSVVLKPYNVSVNYTGTVTIEITPVGNDGQVRTTIVEPLFGSHKINETNNFTKSERVEAACVNKIVDAFEGLIFNKGWFSNEFDKLFAPSYRSWHLDNSDSSGQTLSVHCLQGTKAAVQIAKCLDTAVSGEYLKCLRETMGWEELNWDTIFEWICKGRININSLEICNIKHLTVMRGTKEFTKEALYKCVQQLTPEAPAEAQEEFYN